MMSDTEDGVREVLVSVLGMQGRADQIRTDMPLLGSLPELDSMAVVELMVALEQRFAIRIDDGDLQGEVFETLGSLTEFVDGHLSAAGR